MHLDATLKYLVNANFSLYKYIPLSLAKNIVKIRRRKKTYKKYWGSIRELWYFFPPPQYLFYVFFLRLTTQYFLPKSTGYTKKGKN